MQSPSTNSEATPSPIYRPTPVRLNDKGKYRAVFESSAASVPMERQPQRTIYQQDHYQQPVFNQAGPSHQPLQPSQPYLPPPAEPSFNYSHRPLTALDYLAPADPWGPYAQTPSPQVQFQAAPPQVLMPPPAGQNPPVATRPLNLVSAGPLPPQARASMPLDPINQQHGPIVPDTLLARVAEVDTVEDMNAPFPFQFAQHRACGTCSPVFVSQNGYMQYYAWGDYQDVAMLTMTVPVHRLQSLRTHLDALNTEVPVDAQPEMATPAAPRGRPGAAPGAPRKRRSRPKKSSQS